MTHTIGRITLERGTVAHTCPDCMRGLPCQPAQPAPESSLSRVVADAVNGQGYADGGLQKIGTHDGIPRFASFQPPIYFSNHDGGNYIHIEGEWKREAFPQETM